MLPDKIVTTVKDKPGLAQTGEKLARELGCPFVARQGRSLQILEREYGHTVTVVVGERRLSAWVAGQEFFFHPSMALLRLMNFLKGEKDRMADTLGLQDGMSVLDCTLGFGTDALVSAFLVGRDGKVVGLEASPVVASLVRHGLENYRAKLHPGLDPEKARVLGGLSQAMARIQVLNTHHRDFLAQTADKSFDLVYFDPMFRSPRQESASMAPLRGLALPDPVDKGAVREACRVARRRVVLKESRYSQEFERLGLRMAPGGKYSEVAYGVIEV